MTDEIPMVYLYEGRRIEELTREELLEAFKDLVNQIEFERRLFKNFRDVSELIEELRNESIK